MSITKQVVSELNKLKTIPEKLNYLAKIKREHIEGELDARGIGSEYIKGGPAYETARFNPRGAILKTLYPDFEDFEPHLYVPKSIFDEHFPSRLSNPEYIFWLLKYKAKEIVENNFYGTLDLDRLKESETKDEDIQEVLDELIEFELSVNAIKKQFKIKVDLFKNPHEVNYNFKREIEFLRLQKNYYRPDKYLSKKRDEPKRSYLDTVETGGNITVELYARHWVLKKSLQSQLNQGPDLTLNKSKPIFTYEELALFLYYKGESIPNREIAKVKAKDYGHPSGDRLYNLFRYYTKRTNRVGADTPIKATNQAKRIRAVIPHLSGPQKEMAETELQTLIAAIRKINRIS